MAPLETEHVVAVGATAVLSALAIWIAPKLSAGWVSAVSRGLGVAIILAYGTLEGSAGRGNKCLSAHPRGRDDAARVRAR